MKVSSHYQISSHQPRKLSPDEMAKIINLMEEKGEEVTPEKCEAIQIEYVEMQKRQLKNKDEDNKQRESNFLHLLESIKE